MPCPKDKATCLKVLALIQAGRTTKEIIIHIIGQSSRTIKRVRSRMRLAQVNSEDAMARKPGQGRKATNVTKVNVDKVHKRVVRSPHKFMCNVSKDLNVLAQVHRRLVTVVGFKSMTRLVGSKININNNN